MLSKIFRSGRPQAVGARALSVQTQKAVPTAACRKKVFDKLLVPLEQGRPAVRSRAHIGLIQLSTDHTLESDWKHLSAGQTDIYSTRIPYDSCLNVASLMSLKKEITHATTLVPTDIPMDVMAFGCTSASLVIGEDRVSELLTENRPGVPATNPWTAAKEALRHLGAKKIALISPYPKDITFSFFERFSDAGFEVSAVSTFDIANDTEIAKISKEATIKGIADTLSGGAKVDAIFISCTNFRILSHIEELEATFDLPIVCSNTALYWHALTIAGREVSCPNSGKLLS